VEAALDWGEMSLTKVALFLALASLALAQQQPVIGIPPQPLGPGPFVFDTAEQHKIRVTVVARGIPHPWSLTFLTNGDMLVTEHGGQLRILRNGVLDPTPVAGVPKVLAYRSGGLLDIVAHPKYAENHLVFFTYTKPGEKQGESAIALARAKFDGKALTEVTDLFRGEWSPNASGSRIAFSPDGFIYMTTGAPFDDSSQNLGSVYGKVLRLREDGSVPPDNPYVNRPGARPEVFSFGHRDQLGLTIHPVTGAVISEEHGPNGGDEVNLILPGRNYGWPISSFGRTYPGPRQSEAPWREGIEQPLLLWIPSIAPSGMVFYSGDRFPNWKGNLFTGSSREGEIPGTGHLERVVFNDKLEELRRESLLIDLHQRVRDVRQGPDGLLYLITDENDGAVLRIEPAQ